MINALPRSTRLHLFALLLTALLLRLTTMIYFHTYGPEPYGTAWGFETGMISKSLAEGHGFSSPFGGGTGPTAWFPRLHPALQALVFKLLDSKHRVRLRNATLISYGVLSVLLLLAAVDGQVARETGS